MGASELIPSALILSTRTPHHLRFVDALSTSYKVTVIYEVSPEPAQGPNRLDLEEASGEVELAHWKKPHEAIDLQCEGVSYVDNINCEEAKEVIVNSKPDIAFSFGTRKIDIDTLHLLPEQSLNFHGGNTERYRGLDSILWALYHKDLTGMMVTLHWLSEDLDRGDISMRCKLPLDELGSLATLRSKVTEKCIFLAHLAMHSWANYQWLPNSSPESVGRYYSQIPDDLIPGCREGLALLRISASD